MSKITNPKPYTKRQAAWWIFQALLFHRPKKQKRGIGVGGFVAVAAYSFCKGLLNTNADGSSKK